MAGEVEAAVKRAKEAVEKGDNQQILDEIESINKLTSKFSTEMYKTAGAQKEPQPGPEAGKTPGGGRRRQRRRSHRCRVRRYRQKQKVIRFSFFLLDAGAAARGRPLPYEAASICFFAANMLNFY